MGSKKPHAVCIPFPAQGHINPFLEMAKLLHYKGFHITFVNTEYNHQRLLKSRGPDALDGLPDFRFEQIPDGLPPSEIEGTQDIPTLCVSTGKNCLVPLCELLAKLNSSSSDVPPVTCIVSDGCTTFSLKAAQEFRIPNVLFWTSSACGLLANLHIRNLIKRGVIPFKDETYFTNNGYLDTVIDYIPGFKNIRVRDLPSFFKTTNLKDMLLNFIAEESDRTPECSALIFNTFDELEHDVLQALSSMLPPIYNIGPLHLLLKQIPETPAKSISSNLWKEESECLKWLDSKEPKSVVYVNFGSITIMTAQQLIELAWGLANSKQTFFWVIRPDVVRGDSAILPPEFVEETKERGLMLNWCPQEQVLNHPAVAGFLSHSGWNSTLESIGSGVPMISWPFFADQNLNCRYLCTEWGIGMEIDSNVKRDEVEMLVRELLGGEKGKEMRNRAMEWKKKAEEVASLNGQSFMNLEKLINEVLLKQQN